MEILVIIFIVWIIRSALKQNKKGAAPKNNSVPQLKNEIRNRRSDELKAKMQTKESIQQIQKRRIENRTTSILERAKENANEHIEDVTLNTMEAEHNHSERVSKAFHNHPEDVIPESMLGSVEDLIVKGYDGNLCFERDFLGEGMDMISRFTVPSEVPDYNA